MEYFEMNLSEATGLKLIATGCRYGRAVFYPG